MTRVHRDGSPAVVPRFSLSQDNPAQPRSRIHLHRVRDGHASSRLVIDRRLDVLQQRSVTIHVENLQTVADAEHGLAQSVGILQQQFVHRIAPGIGRGGLRVCRNFVFRGIHVGLASRQEHGIAAVDQFR